MIQSDKTQHFFLSLLHPERISKNLNFFKVIKSSLPFRVVIYEKFYYQSLINNQYIYLNSNNVQLYLIFRASE